MSKIISFSVWGNDSKYLRGALENVDIAKEVYPDWVTRFYCEENTPISFRDQLLESGAEVKTVKAQKSLWEGLFWRFLPASEPGVECFISRDIDSRLNCREKAAVDEWLKSQRTIHCMRDHIEHNVPMLGGMWGCKSGVIENIAQEIVLWEKKDYKGSDQDFLINLIWNRFKDKVITHDRFSNGLTIVNGKHYEYLGVEYSEEDEVYIYDPVTYFGVHDIRAFPKHEPMKHGFYVGEIIE